MTDSSPAEPDPDAPEPVGRTLFRERGGSWWVVAIGPALVIAVVIVELTGPGQVHWAVLSIFFVLLAGFSFLQVYAARQHVSMELTETTLRQGTRTVRLSEIETVFPANTGADPQDWESAPALGELTAVPRRRKGVGLRFVNGKLAQAWARDVDRFRTELTEAHLAVQLGLGPSE